MLIMKLLDVFLCQGVLEHYYTTVTAFLQRCLRLTGGS